MKKILYALIGLTISLSASAQYDSDALTALNAMSAKYKKTNAFTADFEQKLENKDMGLNEKFVGNITVKGDKYLIKSSGQEIYNDGTDLWNYNPEFGEVTVSPYDPEEQEISMGNIYDLYKDGFKYNLVKTNNKGDRFIELDPEDKNKTYFKIKMTISANDELKDFTVLDKSGNTYIYTISNFKPMPNLKDSQFIFDVEANPNVEVIDFR
jgi:outer membrane lipoprotein carrier protein